MSWLWLLRGERTEPGWKELERDSRAEKIDVPAFDRDAGWALILADDPPSGYEGLVPEEPQDGLYVSEQGLPIYVVGRREVRTAQQVIDALGEDAEQMLQQTGDPIRALERLGRAF